MDFNIDWNQGMPLCVWISNTQDFVTFCMRRFPSRNTSSANTISGIKSLRDFQSKDREHQLKLSWMSFVQVFFSVKRDFHILNFLCSSASSTQNVSQVQQELANTRQEAEKLSTENESLSKNYESLLKVTRFFLFEIW